MRRTDKSKNAEVFLKWKRSSIAGKGKKQLLFAG